MIASADYAPIITAVAVLVPVLTASGIQIYMTIRQNRKIAESMAVSQSNSDKLDQHTEKLDSIECATGGGKDA